MNTAQIKLKDQFEFFVANYKGSSFLKELAYYIAEVTSVNYVLIGYPENSELTTIRAAALLASGKMIENYSYPLTGTPCENVIGRNCCYFPSNIQAMFPEDKELRDLNIHSYIGIPVFDVNQKPVGLIALMDASTINDPKEKEEALRAISHQVARELKLFCNY